MGILALEVMFPNAAAAAALTSGFSLFNAFSASLVLLTSFGIRLKTRIAVARSPALSPMHAPSIICQACSFGVLGTLARVGFVCPDGFDVAGSAGLFASRRALGTGGLRGRVACA